MATTSPLPSSLLDDRFPDWWRAINVNAGGLVDARKEAIKEMASTLDRAQIANAVAYAHGDQAAGEALIEFIRTSARTSDEMFAGEVKDAEPAAMVAAMLAHHLATLPGHDDSVVISVLVLAAAWRGLTPVIDGQALPHYARLQLQYAGAEARTHPTFRYQKSAADQVTAAFEEVAAIPEGVPLSDAHLTPQLDAHRAALERLAARLDHLTGQNALEQRLVSEHLRLHTWLLEEWCALAGRAWSDVDAAAVPMISALELASITAGVVPSADAEVALASTIVKAGGDPTALAGPTALIEAAADQLQGRFGAPPRETVFPIAAAHARMREGGSWKRSARRHLGSGRKTQLSVAIETYHELLALRALPDE